MKKTAIFLAASALLSTYSQPSYASDFGQLVSGQQIPLTRKLGDLDDSWRQMSVSGQYEMGDFMKNWAGLLGGSSYHYVYYTQGETVEVAEETYVVAYRLPATGEGLNFRTLIESTFTMGCSDSFLPIKLTPETMLSLSLLNIRTIGSLNDVRTFNLETELSASEKQYEEAKVSCEQMQTTPTEPTEPTESPDAQPPY
jgi:hypothetical protein